MYRNCYFHTPPFLLSVPIFACSFSFYFIIVLDFNWITLQFNAAHDYNYKTKAPGICFTHAIALHQQQQNTIYVHVEFNVCWQMHIAHLAYTPHHHVHV